MNLRSATAWIAIVTGVVSGLVLIGPWRVLAIFGGGFVPARFLGDVAYDPGIWALPAWLTPFSSVLISGGFLELFFEIAMLAFLGSQVEKVIGARSTILLYVGAAASVALARLILAPDSVFPFIGALGPSAAMLGAYSMLFGEPKASPVGPFGARTVQAIWLSLVWAVISLGLSIGHPAGVFVQAAGPMAGFVTGLIFARPLLSWRWRRA